MECRELVRKKEVPVGREIESVRRRREKKNDVDGISGVDTEKLADTFEERNVAKGDIEDGEKGAKRCVE